MSPNKRFKYACFISYRHHAPHAIEPIIDDFYQELRTEVEYHLDKEIFLDKERLQGGVDLDKEFASALCKSACMIVFYTPLYFHNEKPYCAQEFRAMKKLEAHRMSLIKDPEQLSKKLIIPIVFRMPEALPADIKSRSYYNFCDLEASRFKIRKRPKDYYKAIRSIAAYIVERCKYLESLPIDPCTICDGFEFPTVDEVLVWLNEEQHATQKLPTQDSGT